MGRIDSKHSHTDNIWHFAALAAIGLGVYARFSGLGTWPLAVDEYYTAKSVANILRSGVPEFECGGYYVRGLLYHYVVAPFYLLGIAPEYAVRLVAVIFSLIAIPAVYLLGRRLAGIPVAAVAVILFSLSIWEIEFARFGRMYAPFQALFLWYLLFLNRVVIDGDARSQWGMYGLSVLGVLTWEGGIFLVALNFAPVVFGLKRPPYVHLAISASLFALAYAYYSIDFRHLGAEAYWPADVLHSHGERGGVVLPLILWQTLAFDSDWQWAAALPVLWSGLSAYVLLRRQDLPLSSRLGWVLAVALTLLNLFGLALASLVLLLLAGHLYIGDWRKRIVLAPMAAMAANLMFWVIYAGATDTWHTWFPPFDPQDEIKKTAVVLFKYPNVFDPIAFQWLEAVPILTAVMAGLVLIAGLIALSTRNDQAIVSLRLLLFVILSVALLVAVIPTAYVATRYTFFLLPVIYLVALTGLYWLATCLLRHRGARESAYGLAAILSLWPTEDFGLMHLLHVDRMATNYRLNFDEDLAEHYYSRGDPRTPAELINVQSGPGDLIVSTTLPIEFYLDRLDYVYRHHQHGEFAAISCKAGQRERWTNARLLYRQKVLFDLIRAADEDVWLVLDADSSQPSELILRKIYADDLIYTSVDGGLTVHRIRRRPI